MGGKDSDSDAANRKAFEVTVSDASFSVNSVGDLVSVPFLIAGWVWLLPAAYRALPAEPYVDVFRLAFLPAASFVSWRLQRKMHRLLPGPLFRRSRRSRRSSFSSPSTFLNKWNLVVAVLVVFAFLLLTVPRPGEWREAMREAQASPDFSDHFGTCILWLPTGFSLGADSSLSRSPKDEVRGTPESSSRYRRIHVFVLGRRAFGLWTQELR